jgi:hypothetical protein
VSKKAIELAESVEVHKPIKTTTTTAKLDVSVQSTPTISRKGPIRKDPEAIKYIDSHMDTDSGVDIATHLGRSVASINKYIKLKRDGSV